MPNYFVTLAIDPQSLRSFNNEQIEAFVAARYRTLSGLYHPDNGILKSAAKFNEISEARRMLDIKHNPHEFAEQVERFVRRSKLLGTEELEQTKLNLEAVNRILKLRLAQQWFTKLFQAQRGVRGFSETALAFVRVPSFSVSTLPPCVIQLSNELDKKINSEISFRRGHAAGLAINYVDLEYAEDGSFSIYPLTRVDYDTKNELPPESIRHLKQPWVWHDEERKKSRSFPRTGERIELGEDFTLIGSISKNSLSARSLRLPVKDQVEDSPIGTQLIAKALSHLLAHSGSPEEWHARSRWKGFTKDAFEPFFALIEPFVNRAELLVGMKTGDDGELSFVILGQVVGVRLLE